jgi:superfamily II DNA or RNA helicase
MDEIHTLKKQNEITKLLKYINTRNKVGLTGTLPESLIDQWHIIGNIGPVVYEAPREQLVADKRIAAVDVRILKLFYKTQPELIDTDDTDDTDDTNNDDINEDVENTSMSAKYQKELTFLQKNEFRNSTIRKCCEKLPKNILIPVERLEHGEMLREYLASYLPEKKVYFIQGSVENEVREKIKQIMEKENNIICIAISKIFSTGINIKNLHYIILAVAGKAKVRLIQTIGRGVRMLENKDKIVIIDIADQLYYGIKHLEKRLEIYKNENFEYKITPIYES